MAVQAENTCLENIMSFVPFDLCGTQDWVMGDSFCFQEMESFHEQRNEICSDNIVSSSSSLFNARNYAFSGDFVQCLYSELEKQRLEIDGFLQLESQRLRSSILQEQTRRSAFLLQKLESRTKNLISQKDQELAVARNKTMELQYLLTGSQIEAKAWQKKAVEKEAIVVELNNRLNLIRQKHCSFPNAEAGEEDTVSFCDSSSSSTEEKSREKDCKLCQARKSCVVFFPCRHVCCCKSCESLLEQCLVCNTVKGASLEVFLD